MSFASFKLLVDGTVVSQDRVPQVFAKMSEHDKEDWGLTAEQISILSDGPDNELYRQTWEDVLVNAHHEDSGGMFLEHLGDGLYAVRDDVSESEYNSFLLRPFNL